MPPPGIEQQNSGQLKNGRPHQEQGKSAVFQQGSEDIPLGHFDEPASVEPVAQVRSPAFNSFLLVPLSALAQNPC